MTEYSLAQSGQHCIVTNVYHFNVFLSFTSLNIQAILNYPVLAHSQRCFPLRAHTVKPKSASQTARLSHKFFFVDYIALTVKNTQNYVKTLVLVSNLIKTVGYKHK